MDYSLLFCNFFFVVLGNILNIYNTQVEIPHMKIIERIYLNVYLRYNKQKVVLENRVK